MGRCFSWDEVVRRRRRRRSGSAIRPSFLSLPVSSPTTAAISVFCFPLPSDVRRRSRGRLPAPHGFSNSALPSFPVHFTSFRFDSDSIRCCPFDSIRCDSIIDKRKPPCARHGGGERSFLQNCFVLYLSYSFPSIIYLFPDVRGCGQRKSDVLCAVIGK